MKRVRAQTSFSDNELLRDYGADLSAARIQKGQYNRLAPKLIQTYRPPRLVNQ